MTTTAPGTSSSVGRVLGNRDVEVRRNWVQFFRLQKLNRKIAYCCIRRCLLVLSASSAVSALLLLLLLLLLLHYVLLVGPSRFLIFYSNSSAKAIWWWMLYRTLRKVTNVFEYEKKHVRSVGVYSGIMYGCVRYQGMYYEQLGWIPVGGFRSCLLHLDLVSSSCREMYYCMGV